MTLPNPAWPACHPPTPHPEHLDRGMRLPSPPSTSSTPTPSSLAWDDQRPPSPPSSPSSASDMLVKQNSPPPLSLWPSQVTSVCIPCYCSLPSDCSVMIASVINMQERRSAQMSLMVPSLPLQKSPSINVPARFPSLLLPFSQPHSPHPSSSYSASLASSSHHGSSSHRCI